MELTAEEATIRERLMKRENGVGRESLFFITFVMTFISFCSEDGL